MLNVKQVSLIIENKCAQQFWGLLVKVT